jgi:hypothetical protein
MRFIAVTLVTAALQAPAVALDFKGIAVGEPATAELVLDKLGVKCGAGASGMQVCNGAVTIARESAKMNLVINAAGIVQRIDLSLSPQAFEVVAPLLIEKFGPPAKTDRSEVQNRLGAKYEQVIHLWREGDAEALYRRYAGSLDSSSLYFSTKEDRDLLSKRTATRRGDI